METILLIEDDPQVRIFFQMVLTTVGYTLAVGYNNTSMGCGAIKLTAR